VAPARLKRQRATQETPPAIRREVFLRDQGRCIVPGVGPGFLAFGQARERVALGLSAGGGVRESAGFGTLGFAFGRAGSGECVGGSRADAVGDGALDCRVGGAIR
jgi:hypothetical protein